MARFFLVSGLPASGKSTVAAAVASELQLPLIDKDVILEALFDTVGIGDASWRAKLSRAADVVLQRLTQASNGAVVATWWKHPISTSESGTPTEWVKSLPGPVVEIHCTCAPDEAIERFFARHRHPGHLDLERSRERERALFDSNEALGALCLGQLVEVSTQRPLDLPRLVAEFRAHREDEARGPHQGAHRAP